MAEVETKHRVVIYARVSVDRGGKSVDDQVTEARAWCDRENWEVTSVIRETGSASRHARKTRERWTDVAELIESGRVDMLMTWEFTRATRELGFYAALRDTCVRARVRWAYGGTVYDMSRREDRFRTGLDALRAEDEADQTSERVQRGTRQAAARGKPAMGAPSFGYRRSYDPATGKLVGQEPDPETAPVVREIADRLLSGESLRAVARILNDRGVATRKGNQWDVMKLRAMIWRSGLAGLRVHQGAVMGDAEWEPIISKDQHYQLDALFRDPNRLTRRDGSVKHLLSGIVLCGVCGATCMWKKVKNDPKYSCSKAYHVARKQDFVDNIVEHAIIDRLARDDAHDLFTPDRSAETQRAREELGELKSRMNGFYEQAETGELSPFGLARMEKSLLPQIERAETQYRSMHVSPVIDELIAEGPAEGWYRLTVPQRRGVVREMMTVHLDRARVRNRPDPESVRIEWRYPLTLVK